MTDEKNVSGCFADLENGVNLEPSNIALRQIDRRITDEKHVISNGLQCGEITLKAYVLDQQENVFRDGIQIQRFAYAEDDDRQMVASVEDELTRFTNKNGTTTLHQPSLKTTHKVLGMEVKYYTGWPGSIEPPNEKNMWQFHYLKEPDRKYVNQLYNVSINLFPAPKN